jgi:hypothetical protein
VEEDFLETGAERDGLEQNELLRIDTWCRKIRAEKMR